MYTSWRRTLKFTSGAWERAEIAICHAKAVHECCVKWRRKASSFDMKIIERTNCFLCVSSKQATHAFLKPAAPSFSHKFLFYHRWTSLSSFLYASRSSEVAQAGKLPVLLQHVYSCKKRSSFNASNIFWSDHKVAALQQCDW